MQVPASTRRSASAAAGERDARRRRWTAAPAVAAALLLNACATRAGAPAGDPLPDPTSAAAQVVELTEPAERRQITFGWTLDEAGSRVRGRGVVRLQPPDRLRLDLFGPRNETVLAAALVGDQARLPAGARSDVPIPSPALLWAGLGAVRPPVGATLQTARTSGEETILRYGTEAEEFYEYTVSPAPEPRLRQLQRIGSRGPLETVRVEWSTTGELERVSYRDWSAYRDLTLDIEESVPAAEFSPTIWSP